MPNSRIEVKYVTTQVSEGSQRWLEPTTGLLYASPDAADLFWLAKNYTLQEEGIYSNGLATVMAVSRGVGGKTTDQILGGAKSDTGKPRFDLLDSGCPQALLDVVKVLTWAVEVKGYKPHSWKEVPEARRRYEAALSRHRNALARGETHDEGSGFPHQAHIVTNALFLAQLEYEHAS